MLISTLLPKTFLIVGEISIQNQTLRGVRKRMDRANGVRMLIEGQITDWREDCQFRN